MARYLSRLIHYIASFCPAWGAEQEEPNLFDDVIELFETDEHEKKAAPQVSSMLPEPGHNATRIKRLNIADEDIPEEMFCSLSMEVMTDPVYFDGRPNIVFDRSYIERTLALKAEDPFTRVPASAQQLITETNLKKRINDFITQQECHQQHEALKRTQSQYSGFFAHPAKHQVLATNYYSSQSPSQRIN